MPVAQDSPYQRPKTHCTNGSSKDAGDTISDEFSTARLPARGFDNSLVSRWVIVDGGIVLAAGSFCGRFDFGDWLVPARKIINGGRFSEMGEETSPSQFAVFSQICLDAIRHEPHQTSPPPVSYTLHTEGS